MHWKFSRWLRDATDIHRFPIVDKVKTHFLFQLIPDLKFAILPCTRVHILQITAIPQPKFAALL